MLAFDQDEAIFRSSQLNESCWTVDGETTLRTKGLGVGVMVSAFVSRAAGFGLKIAADKLEAINRTRADTQYTDEEAAIYLYGSANKNALSESPFVRYLNYGSGKDGYWTYRHMIIQIEDCIDCLRYLYPQFDYLFELDHSSGHNMERPNGLSTTNTVLNMGWGGKQRKMRSSVLTGDDVGAIVHDRVLKVGDEQFMVFQEDDPPPIFDSDAPPYDIIKEGEVTRNLNKKELMKNLEELGMNVDGTLKVLQARATESNIPITEAVTRKLNAKELKEKLEELGMNSDGNVAELRSRANVANIPIVEEKGNIIEGYVGKPKGALQIACERGFIGLDGKLGNGRKVSMQGTSSKDGVTGVVTIDRTTSVVQILRGCNDFKTEQTQMMYILTLLGAMLILTPKCHPEIAGRGVEYAWGYGKLRFRIDFNDAVASHLKDNVMKSLDASVLTLNRIRKFARKAREYKLTYALLFHCEESGKEERTGKDTIEHLTKLFKAHRSAMDADYGFISSS